jgi:hypothetical protein
MDDSRADVHPSSDIQRDWHRFPPRLPLRLRPEPAAFEPLPPAKLFVAFVSVLLSYGASYLWRSWFKTATASEINRIATDQGEADNAKSEFPSANSREHKDKLHETLPGSSNSLLRISLRGPGQSNRILNVGFDEAPPALDAPLTASHQRETSQRLRLLNGDLHLPRLRAMEAAPVLTGKTAINSATSPHAAGVRSL